jgi:hypothetical protein
MPTVTPQQLLEVRAKYVAEETVASIAEQSGLNRHVVYYCVNGGPDSEGNRFPPLPRRVARKLPSGVTRKALVARLWSLAERQVQDIETRLQLEQPPDERERAARMLAIMIKTLRELRALDAARDQQEPAREDDKGPDNLDDYRRELARKMDAIIAKRKVPGDGG